MLFRSVSQSRYFKPNQFMFYPSCAVGADKWVMVGDGDAVNVDLFPSHDRFSGEYDARDCH